MNKSDEIFKIMLNIYGNCKLPCVVPDLNTSAISMFVVGFWQIRITMFRTSLYIPVLHTLLLGMAADFQKVLLWGHLLTPSYGLSLPLLIQ